MRLFGIPIQIDPSWFVIVGLVSWTLATGYFPYHYPNLLAAIHWGMGVVAAVSLFLCVLLHELGHSLAARAFGIPVARVTLFLFGGVAWMQEESRRPGVELAVALAGPLVSVALAGICYLGATWMPLDAPWLVMVHGIVWYLAIINAVILVFNLLPGLPLDGGRVLRAVLWGLTGNPRQATRVTSRMGSALGVGLMALGVWTALRGGLTGGLWYVLLGFFLRNAAQVSLRQAA